MQGYAGVVFVGGGGMEESRGGVGGCWVSWLVVSGSGGVVGCAPWLGFRCALWCAAVPAVVGGEGEGGGGGGAAAPGISGDQY